MSLMHESPNWIIYLLPVFFTNEKCIRFSSNFRKEALVSIVFVESSVIDIFVGSIFSIGLLIVTINDDCGAILMIPLPFLKLSESLLLWFLTS